MNRQSKIEIKRQMNVDAVVSSILGMLPTLDAGEQNLSLELYRLLAQGSHPREALARRVNVSVETVAGFSTAGPAFSATRSSEWSAIGVSPFRPLIRVRIG